MTASPPQTNQGLDPSLRGYLETNADIVTRIKKPVSIDNIGALSAQSDQPILFENIIGKPGFRLCDILVKNRRSQARALGVEPEQFLRTLAFRLRQPPRGFHNVKSGPVKEIKKLGKDVDWNGSGMHSNFSTKHMREVGGKEYFEKLMAAFDKYKNEHIAVYGPDNHLRLTGLHETQSIDKFNYGIANRGASVRVPHSFVNNGYKGYLEDRRPNSQGDPYQIASRILQTIATVPAK